MLFMAQAVCTVAMYYKGQRNDLQKMMFRFMLYLLLISVVELFSSTCLVSRCPH